MNIFDIFGNKPVEPLIYITPCCSNKFNEQGTPIGYYVDALGREFPQESVTGKQNANFDIPYVNVPREESAAEAFQAVHDDNWWKGGFDMKSEQSYEEWCNTIDVTFEEVKE